MTDDAIKIGTQQAKSAHNLVDLLCDLKDEIDGLRAINAEMLAALKLAEEFLCIADDPPSGALEHCLANIRSARAKAEGKTE